MLYCSICKMYHFMCCSILCIHSVLYMYTILLQNRDLGQGQPPSPKRPRVQSVQAPSFKLQYDKHQRCLSDPFKFPLNYLPEVECALKSKTMMPRTTNRFLTTLARVVFNEKCYLTAKEYESVAKQVIRKYPFLASPAGTPYVRICCV